MMEVISNKSDKVMSMKNKNTFSYKSVSEISEFEEIDQEEPSDFVIRSNKNKSVSQVSKLNESLHSATSHISNNIFEEKDEEDITKKSEKSEKSGSNNNSVNISRP
jgi:hypothetical protein